MTTESNHNDPRVSEAYKSIATETTPAELDRKILAMAAGSSRLRYGLARAWIRPVAWAATIGLSLAIVLELSQVREATPIQFDADAVESLEEVVIRDEAPARMNDDARRQHETAKRSDVPLAPPASAPAAKAGPASNKMTVSDDFEADEMNLLQEAEEQARARSGSEQPPASAAETFSLDAALTLEKKEKVRHCDPDARSSAATWYVCIAELRANGFSEAADHEYELLLSEFPGFEEPGQNR